MLVFMLLFAGCTTLYPYGIVFKNTGQYAADDVELEYDGFYFKFGYVTPGANKGYSYSKVPIPDKALITWKTANDRKKHRKYVEVKRYIPSFFDGDIIFTFNGTNVTTSYEEKKR